MTDKTASRIDETIQRIEQSGVIAILRGDFSMDRILRIAETLVANRISILEVTMNSTAALDAIRRLGRGFQPQELLVGAGTVRTVEQFQRALEAGASFTVAPSRFSYTIFGYNSRNSEKRRDQLVFFVIAATSARKLKVFSAHCSQVNSRARR